MKLTLTMTIAALAALSAGLAAAPVADAQSRGAPRGSYQASCSGAYVNQGRLYADCRDTRGRVRETSIELARCSSSDIGNDDGLLVCHGHRGSFEDRPDSGGGDGSWGGGPSVTFFADSDFRGQSFVVTGETAFLAGFNDRASSARVNGSWEVCEDTRFGGRCERIDRDVRTVSRAASSRSVWRVVSFRRTARSGAMACSRQARVRSTAASSVSLSRGRPVRAHQAAHSSRGMSWSAESCRLRQAACTPSLA